MDHVLQLVELAAGHEGEGHALPARAARAADAVRVVFRVVRQVEVEHDLEVVHVEPARRHVRGDQELEAAAAELVHHARALRLGDVAVQPISRVAAGVQVLVELVHHDLGAAKDDAVAEVVIIHEPREQLDLGATVHLEVDLLHLRGVLGMGLDAHPGRVAGVTFDQVLNHARHRRGEEQTLPLRGHRLEDVLDVVAKTHVEHPVRLVEDDDLQRVQLQRAAGHVVHDAARRADDHLRAGVERAELPLVALAAVDRHLHQPLLEERQLAELLGHLHRQLARRAEHEHLHRAQFHVHLLDRRDGEGCGLARAGRGLADDILARQTMRDDGGLDGRSFLETHLVHGF